MARLTVKVLKKEKIITHKTTPEKPLTKSRTIKEINDELERINKKLKYYFGVGLPCLVWLYVSSISLQEDFKHPSGKYAYMVYKHLSPLLRGRKAFPWKVIEEASVLLGKKLKNCFRAGFLKNTKAKKLRENAFYYDRIKKEKPSLVSPPKLLPKRENPLELSFKLILKGRSYKVVIPDNTTFKIPEIPTKTPDFKKRIQTVCFPSKHEKFECFTDMFDKSYWSYFEPTKKVATYRIINPTAKKPIMINKPRRSYITWEVFKKYGLSWHLQIFYPPSKKK